MIYTIKTTYIGPTNYRGSRIKVQIWTGFAPEIDSKPAWTKTIPYPYEASECHQEAARQVFNKIEPYLPSDFKMILSHKKGHYFRTERGLT